MSFLNVLRNKTTPPEPAASSDSDLMSWLETEEETFDLDVGTNLTREERIGIHAHPEESVQLICEWSNDDHIGAGEWSLK